VLARLVEKLPAAALDPRGVAAGRTLVGITMLAKPGLIPAVLGVDRVTRERTGWLTQMLGAREVALGVGALVGTDRRTWLAGGALSDGVDALTVGSALLGRRVHPVSGLGLVGIAVAAAGIQIDAIRRHAASGR
jgi:hypothetical protein